MATIGLLYDTHISAGGRKSSDGVSDARIAVDKLNAEGVDWTVMGGDTRPGGSAVREDAPDWSGDPDNKYYRSDFEKAKSEIGRLNADYYLLHGNHERPRPIVEEYWSPEEYMPSDDLGNTDNWFGVEERDGVRYVYLNTTPREGWHASDQQQNFVSAGQISMLARLMDQDPTIPTFVFAHAPLCYHDGNSTFNGASKSMTYDTTLNFPKVQQVMERGNVIGVMEGHVISSDRSVVKTVNGIQYCMTSHLGPGRGGSVRWLDVSESSGSATLYDYNVGAGNTETTTTFSW